MGRWADFFHFSTAAVRYPWNIFIVLSEVIYEKQAISQFRSSMVRFDFLILLPRLKSYKSVAGIKLMDMDAHTLIDSECDTEYKFSKEYTGCLIIVVNVLTETM